MISTTQEIISNSERALLILDMDAFIIRSPPKKPVIIDELDNYYVYTSNSMSIYYLPINKTNFRVFYKGWESIVTIKPHVHRLLFELEISPKYISAIWSSSKRCWVDFIFNIILKVDMNDIFLFVLARGDLLLKNIHTKDLDIIWKLYNGYNKNNTIITGCNTSMIKNVDNYLHITKDTNLINILNIKDAQILWI